MLALASSCNAQRKPPADVGLKLGEKIPLVKLSDQNGKEFRSDKLGKNKILAIVFHRSADW